jgi:radical SAM superfamily enzyme YgiQ (UPF0313 family)
VRAADDSWEINDRGSGGRYRIAGSSGALDVTVLESCDSAHFQAVIRAVHEAHPGSGRFLEPDGAPSDALREAQHTVGGQFLTKLIQFVPHVVGFRLEGGGLDYLKRCVFAVRTLSMAEIVIGGPTATSHPREVLEESQADYVFAGEAEEAFELFLELARQHDSKDQQPAIPGLAYRYGGRTYVNTLPTDGYERSVVDAVGDLSANRADTAPAVPEMSFSYARIRLSNSVCGTASSTRHATLFCLRNLVRPAVDVGVIASNRLDWSLLHGFSQELDSLYFTGGRGCPGICTFCAKLHGREFRAKSAEQLLEEIQTADAVVQSDRLRVTRWELFKYVDDVAWRPKKVSWAAIYDEDFLLDRKRAVRFFELWDQCDLKQRYRISLQTNPFSMLDSTGRPQADLIAWIARLKPMIQLGAESFHPSVLARWRKRHNLEQLTTTLDALDKTGQDYTVFQLLTDFETDAEEFVETMRRLILNALSHPKMRIASSPFTIPLYDSDTRRLLEYRGFLVDRVHHFTDYERPQPGWMDPLVAELADLADAELQWALQPEQRDGALVSGMQVVVDRIHETARTKASGTELRMKQLRFQADQAMAEIKECLFQQVHGMA